VRYNTAKLINRGSILNYRYQPYAHQEKALFASMDKTYYGYFMDMGTGKSKVLIDNVCLLYQQGRINSVCIIAPKGVYKNWEKKELPEHLFSDVDYKMVTWSPNLKKDEQQLLKSFAEQRPYLKIFIVNVEALSTKRATEVTFNFLNKNKSLLAVDESTTIKNHKAKRTKNIIKLGQYAWYRRILTGTPITQSPMDLFSQTEFLSKQSLGQSNFFSFQSRYAKLVKTYVGTHTFNKVTGYQNLDELQYLMDKFTYRVKKTDCLDLPDKVYQKRYVELTEQQKHMYEDIKKNALITLDLDTKIVAPTVLTQLIRLQQICSGHTMTDDGNIVKFLTNKTQELLDVIEQTSGKVIVWGNFTQDLMNIKEALTRTYGEEAVSTFYGNTPANERATIVENFQNPNHPLRFFVGQPRTGGYGLTLTEAKTVVYYSNGYDLEVRLQSEDRAHRIGQTNKVTYIDIMTQNTVEEKIIKALRNKINIASTILKDGYKDWII
jgi:SNF2 family DNA or RNA helicase